MRTRVLDRPFWLSKAVSWRTLDPRTFEEYFSSYTWYFEGVPLPWPLFTVTPRLKNPRLVERIYLNLSFPGTQYHEVMTSKGNKAKVTPSSGQRVIIRLLSRLSLIGLSSGHFKSQIV